MTMYLENMLKRVRRLKPEKHLLKKTYNPLFHNQKLIGFNIYASDLKDPKYVDQGCQLLGSLDVDISDTCIPGDLDRAVAMSLTFGDTEIKADCRVKGTDRKVSAKFDFLG